MILVIGGCGYIGSHMVCMLRDAGHPVVVFDNLSRGHRDAIGDTPFWQGDLRNPADLRACLAAHDITVVMHFAALAYVGESVSEPALYYDNNVVGTLNLLAAMRERGLSRLVFSSTCATYGEPQQLPIPESHPQNPINPYGRTKLMVEQALADYARAYDLQSISLRYFNAAGCDPQGRVGERHDPETHLLPLVLAEALRLRHGGNPADTALTVFGDDFATRDGSCVRDYIHVVDLCRAHLLAAERLLAGAVQGAEAFNLANGNGFTVLEVIAAGRRITGEAIGYRAGGRRAGDPACLIGDAARAQVLLGWTPQHPDLDDMVRTAWAWMIRAEVPA